MFKPQESNDRDELSKILQDHIVRSIELQKLTPLQRSLLMIMEFTGYSAKELAAMPVEQLNSYIETLNRSVGSFWFENSRIFLN